MYAKNNKTIKITFIFILILSFIMCAIIQRNSTPFNVLAVEPYRDCAELVIDVNSLRVLHEKNSDRKMYMASTTKILTAIVIIENCNLDDVVTVTPKTVGIEGSSIYLEAGEKLSVRDLLYGLMLRSGNDCAETLAIHCSGSINEFADLMNKTAQRIGAKNSNFVNPHGLHNDNHYTTAYDLGLISAYAIKNDEFKKIVSTQKIEIPWTTREYNRFLSNKNKMLKEFEGSTGIKTGFTKKAGRCLVSSCERDGKEFVCVVLNCPPMFERSKELLTEAFINYNSYNLVCSDNIVDFINVENRNEKCGVYIKKDISVAMTEEEYENYNIVYELPDIIAQNTKKDTPIGKIKIYSGKNLLFEENIYTIIDV